MKGEELRRRLREASRVVLTTHTGPDGDGFGAELAMLRWLRGHGVDARIVNPDAPDPRLEFLLQPDEEAEVYDPALHDAWIAEADLILLLDVNTWTRLGRLAQALRQSSAARLCVDHHRPGEDAFDGAWVDEEACATGQMIFECLEEAGEVTPAMAEPLYASLHTDTGGFRFSRTSPRVHRIAARLLELGVQPDRVYENLYENHDLATVKLTGEILATTETACKGRLVWQSVSREMLERHGAELEQVNEVVNWTISLRDVEVGILFKELAPGRTKASLRSKGRLDVNAFARSLGGGGHRHAAGIVLEEPFPEGCRIIVEAARRALGALEDAPEEEAGTG